MSRPLRIAHRGDHRTVPENTLAAFRAALAVPGCDGLEFDVQLSQDGVPVVLHDDTLDRVQGVAVRCDELTAGALAAHGIPTLAETLAAAPSPAFLDIELKTDCGPAAIEAIDRARGRADGGLDRAVVSSFEPAALATVARVRPGWPTWLNAEDLTPATIALATSLGCRGISAERGVIDEASALQVREAGLELAAWTVIAESDARRLGDLGAVALCVEGEALDR